MASPLRSPEPTSRRAGTPGLEVIPTLGRSAAGTGAPAGRLRVAGSPELLSDDDHPDFHHLPTVRGRR